MIVKVFEVEEDHRECLVETFIKLRRLEVPERAQRWKYGPMDKEILIRIDHLSRRKNAKGLGKWVGIFVQIKPGHIELVGNIETTEVRARPYQQHEGPVNFAGFIYDEETGKLLLERSGQYVTETRLAYYIGNHQDVPEDEDPIEFKFHPDFSRDMKKRLANFEAKSISFKIPISEEPELLAEFVDQPEDYVALHEKDRKPPMLTFKMTQGIPDAALKKVGLKLLDKMVNFEKAEKIEFKGVDTSLEDTPQDTITLTPYPRTIRLKKIDFENVKKPDGTAKTTMDLMLYAFNKAFPQLQLSSDDSEE